MQADIFVVADIATVLPRVQWLAVLGGGRVCDMKFVLSGGKHGVSVLYKRAMATRRTVFLSDAFITRHPKLAGLVLRKAGDPACAWKLMTNRDDFLALARKCIAQKKRTEVVAFITPGERAFDSLHFRIMGASGLGCLKCILTQESTSGVCGR